MWAEAAAVRRCCIGIFMLDFRFGSVPLVIGGGVLRMGPLSGGGGSWESGR